MDQQTDLLDDLFSNQITFKCIHELVSVDLLSFQAPPMSMPVELQVQGTQLVPGNPGTDVFQEEQQQEVEQTPNYAQVVERRKRSSNTIFKTSLAQFRKTILDVVYSRPKLYFAKQEIQNSYKNKKNQGVFPKFLAIIRQLNISKEIEKKWSIRSKQLISKKEKLIQKGKFSAARLLQLQATIDKMDLALEEEEFWSSFDLYWGNFRQNEKYEKCKRELSQFVDRITIEFPRKFEEMEKKQGRRRDATIKYKRGRKKLFEQTSKSQE